MLQNLAVFSGAGQCVSSIFGQFMGKNMLSAALFPGFLVVFDDEFLTSYVGFMFLINLHRVVRISV